METPDDTERYNEILDTLLCLKNTNGHIISNQELSPTNRFVKIAIRENQLIDIIEQLVHKVRRLEALEPDERPESPSPTQLPKSGKMTKS